MMTTEHFVNADAETRVLVVDNEPANVALLTKILVRAGFGFVEGVQDSSTAVERVRTFAPDIVLLDLHMPHPDGFEILERLGGIDHDGYLPVVVLTADVSEVVKERALSLGASDFLTKPFPVTETLLRVRNLVRARRLHQELERHVSRLSAELAQHESADEDKLIRQKRVAVVVDAPDQNITMVYQPIVDLRRGTSAGAEALARFSAVPIRPPNEWFADAAEAGLGIRLELEAVRLAIAEAHLLPPDAFLSVNLSPTALRSPALGDVIHSAGERPIVIELTEHDHIEDYGPIVATMEQLRTQGCRFAVDDAGAGFAGLHHILRLQPEFIKLDIVLVAGIDHDPARRSLASALVRFAEETGAAIIAEGIETASELETLRTLGVQFGQGYHLARPGPLPLPTIAVAPSAPG